MEVRSKTGFNQIIFGVVFILTAFLAYRLILYTESQLLLLLGGALAVISIAWRPISLALGLGYKHSEPDAGSAIHKVQVSTLHIK